MDIITLLSQKRSKSKRTLEEKAKILAQYITGKKTAQELFPDSAYPHSSLHQVRQSVLKAIREDENARKIVEQIIKQEQEAEEK